MRRLIRASLLAMMATMLLAPGDARGQVPIPERCAAVPDTSAAPSSRQIGERRELRQRIASTFTAHGASPRGLLFVDVDSTRVGVVRFLDAPVPDSTIQAATAVVAEYLRSLERGRAYQALIRVDGEYPAVLPGRVRCQPLLDNVQMLMDSAYAVSERHPLSGTVERNVVKHADVMLVINREGTVSWVQVVQPTGDDFFDPFVPEIAWLLRFVPASLDGTPIDVRTRFRLTFTIR